MENNPFVSPVLKPKQPKNPFITLLQILAVILVVIVLGYLFVITPNQVDGSSMFPTLVNNELILVNRVPQTLGGTIKDIDYKHGDIVVIKLPGFDADIVKRVIGLPGDRIKVSNGAVYLNGEILTEAYLPVGTNTAASSFISENEEIIVGAGKYILFGDNRGGSIDSRSNEIGEVSRASILGKVILRFWPLEKFGGVK